MALITLEGAISGLADYLKSLEKEHNSDNDVLTDMIDPMLLPPLLIEREKD